MMHTFIARRCGDLPVAACSRVMGVSTSAFYAWAANPVSDRDRCDAEPTNQIFDIHRRSRRSYLSPGVHDELVLGEGMCCSRKRVERLMRQARIVGIHRRKGWRGGCTRRDLDATPSDDLVQRRFAVDGPDRLWVMDVTEHPTREGKVYLAIVLDAWSRRVVGWSIADHIRSELVVDAVQMAIRSRAYLPTPISSPSPPPTLIDVSGVERSEAAVCFSLLVPFVRNCPRGILRTIVAQRLIRQELASGNRTPQLS